MLQKEAHNRVKGATGDRDHRPRKSGIHASGKSPLKSKTNRRGVVRRKTKWKPEREGERGRERGRSLVGAQKLFETTLMEAKVECVPQSRNGTAKSQRRFHSEPLKPSPEKAGGFLFPQ